jgi:hypothetical protein
MAKVREKMFARKYRREGRSIKAIARILSVSPSSVSLWCEDIRLTESQIQKLDIGRRTVSMKNLLKGAQMNKEKKFARIALHRQEARGLLKSLTKRELLIAGLGLYWGEGVKKGNTAIVNSDPKVIAFAMRWFTLGFGVPVADLRPRIFINHTHAARIDTVEAFWSQYLGIPKSQFAHPVLIKRANKKVYENHDLYYGVVMLRVCKATDLKYKILGLIDALAEAGVAQVVRASHS